VVPVAPHASSFGFFTESVVGVSGEITVVVNGGEGAATVVLADVFLICPFPRPCATSVALCAVMASIIAAGRVTNFIPSSLPEAFCFNDLSMIWNPARK